MAKKAKAPKTIGDGFDDVVGKLAGDGPMAKYSSVKALEAELPDLVPPPLQGKLFHVEKQVEIDGVEMGVLDNGVPYLTESGLARMCGVDRKVINRLAINWESERGKPRGAKISELLIASGYTEDVLFLKSDYNTTEVNAYTEPVCLALLEYYAFLAEPTREQAITAFRRLARHTFRTFIYDATGYNPNQNTLDSWQHFHDRLDLSTDTVPEGYFSIFREIAEMIVPMIRSGVLISDKVVPDISVGMAWSKFWTTHKLSERCGEERVRYMHNYPDYYPQAKSNPQPAFAYPDIFLGVFRKWLRSNYIETKLPNYLLNQAKKGTIPTDTVARITQALAPKRLEDTK